jgi:cob(I)alamin adenosyltransferase
MTAPPNAPAKPRPKLPPKAKIYTRTGDQGKTRLVGGGCVDKFNPRVEAYGTADELNSYLGIVRSLLIALPDLQTLNDYLESIQNELFNVGSQLACEEASMSSQLPPISADAVLEMEKRIDDMDHELPKLTQFILPAGHLISSHLHFARTLCRRAERRTAELHHHDSRFQDAMIFLNRLSDFLFIAARWVNFKTQQTDVTWKKQP